MAYVDLTSRFTYELQTVFGDFSKMANNDKWIKENGWQDGTVGVFLQAAAPTGWTKVTTQTGKALRVVSGSGGGTGGSLDPASAITLAHTHTVPTDADHTHVLQDHTAYLATSGSDRSNGVSVVALMSQPTATFNYPAKSLNMLITSGAVAQPTKKNELAMTGGPYTSGAGGTHDHGGVSASALSNVSLAYVDILFCSKDTSTGYTDLSSTFVHNTRHVFDYLDQCAENDAFNYARRTPAGTVSLFGTATAPTGWTKLASLNGKVLRVTDGTGAGTGGSADPATAITLAHDHGNLTSGGAHTHTIPGHVHELGDSRTLNLIPGAATGVSAGQIREWGGAINSGVSINLSYTATDGSGTSTSDGAHQHATGSSLANITLAYFNVIQASKDSTGAAHSYTDMTTFFVDQDLLAYQELQTMANNDDYLHFHVMPIGGVMFFFQSSAPLNWTKSTDVNDRILRITSSTDGGTEGGSNLISSGIVLAHTHSIDSKSHSHTFDHTHTLAKGVNNGTASTVFITNTRIFGEHGAEMYRSQNGGAGDVSRGDVTETVTAATDSVAHTHGGSTGSSMSTITLAYSDVIMCTKS